MSKWIVVATVLLESGGVSELPAARQFDRIGPCIAYRDHMLVAYDAMIAREQALAERRCEGSLLRGRCADEEFRSAVPWILLGYPRCNELPTQ